MVRAVTIESAHAGQAAEAAARAAAENGSAAEDRALVLRAASGDVEAFGKLFERYKRPIAALISRMASHPDDVDDILPEVFVRAWKGLPRFRGDAQFSTWLYRIAINTAIKHRSRRKAKNPILSTDDASGGLDQLPDQKASEDPQMAMERRELQEKIQKAVCALPEKHRSVIVLHHFEHHTCEEIGRILGCSVGTVWSRLHYANRRLKALLGEEVSGYS